MESGAIRFVDLILPELLWVAVQTACDLTGVSRLNSVHSWLLSETSYSLNNFKCKYNLTMKITLWALGLHCVLRANEGSEQKSGDSLRSESSFT